MGDAGVQAHTSASPSRLTSSPRLSTVVAATRIAATPGRVFAFHADARNLPRLMPGPVRIRHAPVPTRQGDRQLIEMGPPGLRRRWLARITVYDPPRRIVDVQERGPFRVWEHSHTIVPDGDATLLVDRVRFAFFPLPWLDRLLVAPVLRLLFAERHRRSRRLLTRTP